MTATPQWFTHAVLGMMQDESFQSILEQEVYRGAAVDRPIPYSARHIKAALAVADFANPGVPAVQTCQVWHDGGRIFFSVLPKAKRGSTDRPVLVPDEYLFTPRDGITGFRFVMQLSAEDRRTLPMHGGGLRGTVTDEITGRKYKVYGASCGTRGHMCDAIVRPVVVKETR